MEETKNLQETPNVEEMISVAEANKQIQNVITEANNKLRQLAVQVQQLDAMVKDKVIEQMIEVIKHAHMFNQEFVDKCVETVEKYLSSVITPTETETPVEEEKAE